ncbi:MAG: outer membrane protein assembly factor BamA [Holosporaceae bacterium]|jgi:outer membrane protein insertion porin family|nr:outer membrane protein assembly factor BamA [Holosporaceae bacterium]
MKKILSVISLLSFASVSADVVDKIEFEGLDRVEPEALQDCLTIKAGKNYDQSDIDATLKALFAKDFFSYIKFLKRGNTLVIKCVEKPMVDKVAFEGNDAASDDVLKNIVNGRIGEGRLFSLSVVKDILSDFQLAYKALGYCSAIITPKMIKHPGNRIDIVFEISEGSKTTVKKILFVGNKTFSDDELKDLLSTKEARIWRFWDYESHVFREDKVDVDVENITSFYKDNGFPFFMVTSTTAEMDFDRTSHYCTFTMEEGDRYTIKGVSLDSKVDKIKAEDFKQYITLLSGSIYNESQINGNRDRIRAEIALKDHPFTDVVVDTNYDKVNKTANIKYLIVERPKVFVERIEIVGNLRTLDKVIRREFSIHEGDAYNVYKVQRTVERLKGTDYFDDVQISDAPGSAEDKKVLIVNVKEKESTTQVRFGLNVSDADGFGAFVGFVENNLFGTGRTFAADIFWMQRYYGCKLNIFDPHFMDQNFGAGLSVGAHQYNRKNIDSSVTKTAYISPYIRYRIRENLWHKIAYTVSFNNRRWWDREDNKLRDNIPSERVSDYIENNRWYWEEEFGKYTSSEISSVLSYDQTDNPYEPRRGYDLALTNAFAGVGGNVRYLKNELEGNYYYPLTKKVTFVTAAAIGHIHEMKGTRTAHRFALGGDGASMRGFDYYGVGPHGLPDKYGESISVGGNKYWTLSFMLKAPLSTREMGINGVVFLDFGSAWGTKYSKEHVQDSAGIRSSAGFAIEWARSPLGVPLSFVFGFSLKKKKFDEKQTFTLTGFM